MCKLLCGLSEILSVNLLCSAAHPVLSPLHKPVTVAQFYAQRKIHKKEAKAAGKVYACFLSWSGTSEIYSFVLWTLWSNEWTPKCGLVCWLAGWLEIHAVRCWRVTLGGLQMHGLCLDQLRELAALTETRPRSTWLDLCYLICLPALATYSHNCCILVFGLDIVWLDGKPYNCISWPKNNTCYIYN